MWTLPYVQFRDKGELMHELISVLSGHVFPPVEGFASAQEVGVDRFLKDRLVDVSDSGFLDTMHHIEKHLVRAMQSLDQFFALTDDEREAVLKELVDIEGGNFAKHWALFIRYCLQGYLADPKWNGNRNGLGWKSVGLTGPKFPQVPA